MERFQRAKLAMVAIRSYATFTRFRPSSNSQISSQISPASSPIFQRFGLRRMHHNPFPGGGFFDLGHIKDRGPRMAFLPKFALIVVLIGSWCYINFDFDHWENVPYTKRRHFVLFSKPLERKLREYVIKDEILREESVRVGLIAKEIIERGLKEGAVWRDNDEALIGMEGQTRTKAQQRGGFDWEVLVVDKPIAEAVCSPGGKIVVYTGLLKHLKTDAEVATIIGRVVGHAVARQDAELLTQVVGLLILHVILWLLPMPDLNRVSMSALAWALVLHQSRRMEREADKIGLLLMASAGYDPRVAPLVYDKLGKADRQPITTHPYGKTRSQLVAKAKEMKEALAIYRKNSN